MSNSLYTVANNGDGNANDLDQLVKTLQGLLDAGALTLLGPVDSPASAPAIALSSGSITGTGYEWGVFWITGIPVGNGSTYNTTGVTLAGPVSTAQALSSQEATVSIAALTIPTGVIGWGVVRNKSGGSTFYEVPNSRQFLSQAGAMPTTFVDNTPDANLTTAAPSSNTTGTRLTAQLYGASGAKVLDLLASPAALSEAQIKDAAGNLIADLTQTNPGWTLDGPLTPNGGIVGAIASGSMYNQDPWRPNLCVEPGFGCGGAYWSAGNGNAWSFVAGDGVLGMTQPPSGAAIPANTQWWIYGQRFPAVAGEYYCVSALGAFGLSAGSASIIAVLAFLDGAGALLSGPGTSAFPTSGAWSREFVVAQAPANTAYARVELVVTAGASGATLSGGWFALPKLERVESASSLPSPWTCDLPIAPSIAPNIPIPGLHAAQADSLGGTLEVEVLRFWGQQQNSSLSNAAVVGSQYNAAGSILLPYYSQELGLVDAFATYILEARIGVNSSGETAYLAIWDTTTGAVVATSQISSTFVYNSTGTEGSLQLVRSGAITGLTAGHKYKCTLWGTTSGSFNSYCDFARLVAQI